MCKQNLKTNEPEALDKSAWREDPSCRHGATQNDAKQRREFSDLLEDLRLEQQELH